MTESDITRAVNITKKEIPEIMRDDVRKIILYGSCARGDYNDDSDIDIAILTNSDRSESKQYGDSLDELAAKIGMDTFVLVNFVCVPYEEFDQRKNWYPYFVNINRDGVLLYERK